MKVKVSDFKGTEKEMAQIESHINKKIKRFITVCPNKFRTLDELCSILKIGKKGLEFKVVCMNCGEVTNMATYAIAQIASRNKIKYTCGCGHITVLPQIN